MRATIRLDHTLIAVEDETTVHAMLELVAPAAADGGRGCPSTSPWSSTAPAPWAAPSSRPKRCAEFLVDRLGPTDRLTLVTFDDTCRRPHPRWRPSTSPP